MTSDCRGFSAALLRKIIPFARIMLVVAFVLSLAASGAAQQQKADDKTVVTIPAGTRINLVLTHPVDSKAVHKGDEIYAQITAPIAVGDRVAIPAGTFVQGRIEKLARKQDRGEFQLQSLSLVYPDGYIANAGSMHIETEQGTAWPNPSSSAKAGASIAPFAGLGLGAAIGRAAHTTQTTTFAGSTTTTPSLKGVAIGSMVGAAAGGVVALVLLVRSRDFYVDTGSPMEMTLAAPLSLAAGHVMQTQPLAVTPAIRRPQPSFPEDHGICRTPDTPGTPPTIIPGTPPIGDSPGTPDITIPGTPAIPGTEYPCP